MARGGIALLLSILFAADCVNSYYSYLPNVSDVVDAITQDPPQRLDAVLSIPYARAPAGGRLASLTVPEDGSGLGQTQAWVWLPPQYFTQPARRFPVVYLFHGSPGDPKDWFHAGRAQHSGSELADAGRPVIEVAPQMSRNWLDDSECVNGVHEKVESHLLDDVIPTVDRSLRTIVDRTGRIFAGMSAGGYCALNLGLRNRNIVATILDLSGYTSPTHAGGLRALFGPDVAIDARPNDPAAYADALTAGPPMWVWLDSGKGDHNVLTQMKQLTPILNQDHMHVVESVRPGGHTYSTWRPALAQSLRWALTN